MATTKKKPIRGLTGNAKTELESQAEPQLLTVNGKPIPSHFAHAIPYALTDQGIAEREAEAAGKPKACVQMISDEWDKMLGRRENAVDTFDSPDPMKEAVDRVSQPGMSYKFLSPQQIEKKGLRGYEVVAIAGDPVKVGRMVLGQMPTTKKERRNAHYQKIGNDDLAAIEATYKTDLEKAVRDAGLSPDAASVLRSGDELHDTRDPIRGAHIGVRQQRGEEAA